MPKLYIFEYSPSQVVRLALLSIPIGEVLGVYYITRNVEDLDLDIALAFDLLNTYVWIYYEVPKKNF